jgi:hypothetical protein
MRRILMSCALVLVAAPAASGPLTVVQVGAPAINCLFDPACTVVVHDTSSAIPLAGAAGTAFLQSRTFKGKPGTPAAGFWAYEYRLDLRQAYGIVNIPCVSSMTVPIGSLGSLDFDEDGVGGDHVFVVSAGGLGTIGIASANRVGTQTTFTFDAPVCAGSSPGTGDSTFFFGLVSKSSPVFVTATLTGQGGPYSVQARAPAGLLALPGNYFGFFMLADSSRRGTASLAIEDQSRHRAAGSLTLDDDSFPIEGTIAYTGHFVAAGGSGRERIVLRGEMRESNGLLVFEGEFQRWSGGALKEAGSVVVVQDPR